MKYQISLAHSTQLEDYQAKKGRELPLDIMRSRAGTGIAGGWNCWLDFIENLAMKIDLAVVGKN